MKDMAFYVHLQNIWLDRRNVYYGLLHTFLVHEKKIKSINHLLWDQGLNNAVDIFVNFISIAWLVIVVTC